MPPPRVPNSVVKLVLELADQQKDAAEIAQMLNLKKVQVSTLLAYHKQVAKKPETEEPTSQPDQASEAVVDIPADPQTDSHEQIAVAEADELPGEPSIEEASEGEVSEEETSDDGVYVGDDFEYGDAIYWNPQQAGAVPNPHLMIVGESGSGKTYAVQCLVAELAQKSIP